jgi:AraC family transcriptional regulator
MNQKEPARGEFIDPLEWHKTLPIKADMASDWPGWIGLQALRCRKVPAFDLSPPAMTHHRLVLYIRPPAEMDLVYEGVKRHVPPPAGAISVVPAGSPAMWRWSGRRDTLHAYLEPRLVARVAAEAFDLDPARLTVPPLDGLDLPHLRAAMWAVDAELTSRVAGEPLAVESLANILAVQLIRCIAAPRRPERRRDGTLPRRRLRAVLEYIEEHFDASPSLEQMAAVARLSAYHFARQFKAATGLPPHQYLVARRVDCAKLLLQTQTYLPLAEVAARAGFSDQSQFTRHFRRIVGLTPGRFRRSARVA